MNFDVTLVQNLPNRDAAAFDVRYHFRDGTVSVWRVDVVGPYRDRARIQVSSPANLIRDDVLTRTLISHYPTPPTEVETQISSVQL